MHIHNQLMYNLGNIMLWLLLSHKCSGEVHDHSQANQSFRSITWVFISSLWLFKCMRYSQAALEILMNELVIPLCLPPGLVIPLIPFPEPLPTMVVLRGPSLCGSMFWSLLGLYIYIYIYLYIYDFLRQQNTTIFHLLHVLCILILR